MIDLQKTKQILEQNKSIIKAKYYVKDIRVFGSYPTFQQRVFSVCLSQAF